MRSFRQRSPDRHAHYLSQLSHLHYSSDYNADTQTEFNSFYTYLHNLLDSYYPKRTITVTSSEPKFMTPALKAMLRRRNRLMRASRIDEASALARRIGQVIQYRNSIHLRRTDKADLNDMWRKVRQITGRQNRRFETPLGITADVLNQHYANISNDASYQPLPSNQRAVRALTPSVNIRSSVLSTIYTTPLQVLTVFPPGFCGSVPPSFPIQLPNYTICLLLQPLSPTNGRLPL